MDNNNNDILQPSETIRHSRTLSESFTDPLPTSHRHRSFSVSLDDEKPPEYHIPVAGRESLGQPESRGRVVLTEYDCYDELGFCFPTWRKWMIISVIFLVQVSMNFNTSLYSNAINGISQEFGVSLQAARCGAMIYLVTYAFGTCINTKISTHEKHVFFTR